MTTAKRYPPELRERAVRMLKEQRNEYKSEHAAINSIAPKIGCTPDTLRVWVRQSDQNTSGGGDDGLTTNERQRLKELERENRELRRSNEILRQASAYFSTACGRNSPSTGFPAWRVRGRTDMPGTGDRPVDILPVPAAPPASRKTLPA